MRERDRLVDEHGLMLKSGQVEVKPDRETIINKDDVYNLRIALNTAKTIEELLELM